MAFTYTDRNKKTVLARLAPFKAVVTEAVVTGDLVSWYDSDATSAFQFADQSDSQPAQAVALQDIAAGEEGDFALAAILKAPTSIATGGIVTQSYFGAESDNYGVALYLGESGKPASAQGGTYVQLVGYNISRYVIVLQPNTALTGVAGSFTTLAASSAVTFTDTLAVSGVATFAVQDVHTLGLTVATLKPLIQGVISLPKMLGTTKANGSGAWTITAAELIGGFIIDTTDTGGSAPTMPTVAAVIALLPGYIAGTTLTLIFKNIGNQTATLTTDGSAEWTMSGLMTIITKETRVFYCRITGANAGTVYSGNHSTTLA